jgi:transcriptional regulator with GAF, ATPase, and Fis domain
MTESPEIPGHPVDADTALVFRSLADLVYAQDDYAQVHAAVVHAAPRVVTGCHHASLMLRDGEEFCTAAASDDVARFIDEMERELGEGPCVDAIVDDPTYVAPDLSQPSDWPRLSARVLAETQVRGMAGFRMFAGDRTVGALNLFSDDPGGLTQQSVHQGMVLASFVTMAVLTAEQREAASSLREGLLSNREIGKAVGLMMAFHKVSDDDAFAMLRKASQDMNIKVAEVARQVVEHHNSR